MTWTPSSSSGIPTPRCCGASSATGWRAGAPCSSSSGRDEFSFLAADLELAAIGGTQVDHRALEMTRGRIPQAVVRLPIPLRFFQVTGTIDRDRLDGDVGTSAGAPAP